MSRLTRRVFIGTGVTATLAAGGSFLACGGAGDTLSAALHRFDVFRDSLIGAEQIGRMAQATSGMPGLLYQASLNPDIQRALRTECPTSRLAILQARAQADFAAGRFRLCARFVVADTEYVLAGLTQKG